MQWHPLSLLGLTLIAAGWFIQFRNVTPKRHEIVTALPLLNSIGVLLLIIDSIFGGQIDLAVFNVLTMAGALLVLLSMSWKVDAKKANGKKQKKN